MKFSKKWLYLFIPLIILLFALNVSSVSTVLLGIKGNMTSGNLVKFSGTAGVGEDAGVAASNITFNKFDATSAPTVSDGINEGYTVGSKWYDVTADKGYVCLDSTNGASVWSETTSQGTTTFTGLNDTPASYDDGKYAKSTTDGVIWDTPAGVSTFTGLNDTPASYDDGKYAKSTTDGVIWDTPAGVSTFTGLTDTPASYDDGKYAKSTTDGVIWDTPAGVSTFTGLTDTPSAYTGEAGKVAAVNTGETALEFITVGGETNTASNVGGNAEIFKQKTGVDLEFRTLKAGSSKMTLATTGTELIKYEEDVTGDDNANAITSNPDYWKGQSFTTTSAHSINSVKVRLKKAGTPGDLSVNFYLANGSHLPTGEVLGTGTLGVGSVGTSLALYEITLNTPFNVSDATEYVFLLYTDSGSLGNDYVIPIDTGNSYAGGVHVKSNDGGSSFNIENSNDIAQWQIYGTGAVWDYIEFDVVPSEISLDTLGATTDNTDNDASTTAHGLMPKLSNDTAQFLGGTGAWTNLAEKTIGLLSTTTVDFNADADTTLYTVPTGKRCILSHAIVVAAGDAGATTTLSIGQDTTETDFVPANTLSNLDAQYDAVILQPIPNTTPLKIKSYAAGTVIQAQVASQSGVAGNTVYLFGVLY